jgi:hypothetical protein
VDTPSQPAQPEPPTDTPIETPAGPPAVTVFAEVPSSEELARQAGAEEADGDDAQLVATTDAVRHEYDGGRLIAIEIEEGGSVTRLERGDDGWSVHPGG